jgi:ankyrin repeat protein
MLIEVLDINKDGYREIINGQKIDDKNQLKMLFDEFQIVQKDLKDIGSFGGIITPDTEDLDQKYIKEQPVRLINILYNSVMKGDITSLQKAINEGADPTLTHPEGLSHSHLIHLASWNGEAEILETLIKAGAKVNRQNSNGNTAIFFAVFRKYLDVFKILVKYGADVEITNNAGISALDLMENKGLEEFLEFYQDNK